MASYPRVKFLISSCLLAAFGLGLSVPQTASAQSSLRTFACAGRDVDDGLPVVLRIKVLSSTEIEVDATDKSNRDSQKSTVKSLDIKSTSSGALFLVGGLLGVSGDVRLIISKEALQVGELGTVMLLNHSTRESGVYPCSTMPRQVHD